MVDLMQGFAEAAFGFIETAFNAGHHAVVVELLLEIGDLLFEGDNAGFEFGYGHGRAPL
jgi:hypothetical protein